MSDRIELAQVGEYSDIDTAAQRALVCLAMGAAYWLFEENGRFILWVDARDEPRLTAELAAFEKEERAREHQVEFEEPVSPWSIFVFVWLMTGAFLFQSRYPDDWVRLGGTSRAATIEQGEWWRALTALFLHGDIVHLGSNLFFGSIFVYATLRQLGTARAWGAIILAGGFGNWINSALRPELETMTIGASTGVFAALGVVTACRIWEAAGHSVRENFRRWTVPLGGGLALLALYGSSSRDAIGQPIDFMAHLFGFVSGLVTGSAAWWIARRRGAPQLRKLTV